METIQIVPNPVPLPPLGVLLHQFRVDHDESVETVSRRGLQAPIEVVRLEIDRTHFGLDQLELIVDCYSVPRRLFPPDRSRVVVDLVAGTVSVAIATPDRRERQEDRILLTYLELLYEARGLAASHALALTALHVGVLRDVLSSRSDAVEHHLEDLLEQSPDDEPSEHHHRHVIAALAFLAAGMFLADLRSEGRPHAAPTVVTSQPAPVRPTAPAAFRVPVLGDWTFVVQRAVETAAADASADVAITAAADDAITAAAARADADAATITAAEAASTGDGTHTIATTISVDPPVDGWTPTPAEVEIGDAVTITPDGIGTPTPVEVEIGEAVTITRQGD
jgi:hypothetical protein